MMLVLGIFSFLQMTILPGWLILRLVQFKGKGFQSLVSTFGLSLVSNYILVNILVILRIYIQPVVLILICAEVAALIWLYRHELASPWEITLRTVWEKFTGFLKGLLPQVSDADGRQFVINCFLFVFRLVVLAFAVFILLWIGRVFLFNIGTVFNEWDAVVSWNPWAVQWAQNLVPQHTYQYPQLIPTNWSLSYVMMGTTAVQFAAKALMPLFLLFVLVMIFDLGLDYRTAGYFIAVTLTGLMIKNFLGEFIADGYCDIPAAFFAFLAVYSLLKIPMDLSLKERNRILILGALFAGGAAITKQTGGYILVVYPLLVYLLILIRTPGLTFWQKVRQALFLLGISVLLAAPWYIYKQITFALGTDSTEVGMVLAHTASTYNAADLLTRAIQALSTLEKYAWVVAFIIPAMLFLKPSFRWIAIVIALPYTLLWSIFLSADTRNLALAMPFIGLVAGVGAGELGEWLIRKLGKLAPERWHLWYGLVLLACVFGAVMVLTPTDYLIRRQDEMQRRIFNPSINEQVYAALEGTDPSVRILTNYPVQYLPGLEDRQFVFWYNNYQDYLSALRNPTTQFLLVPGYANEEIAAQIEENLADGDFTLLYSDNSWIPYRLIAINQR